MDKPFTGFSTDRQKTIRMPEGFFLDVLPQIGSMLEMKLTLFLFWRLARGGPTADNRQRTIDDGAKDTGSTASSSNVQRPTSIQAPRMVSLADLEADAGLRSALARNKGPRPVEEAIREALELAVARGTILQLWVREEPTDVSEGRAEQWFV